MGIQKIYLYKRRVGRRRIKQSGKNSILIHSTPLPIEDEIVYSLYGATTLFLSDGNKIFPIRRKYVEQAKKILHHINVFRPVPVFVINMSDISPTLKRELEKITQSEIREVITGAVARILEDVDPRFSH